MILGISFVTSMLLELEISKGLINFSVGENFQELLSLFNFIKFTSNVFSDMPKVFQGDISLSEVLLLITFGFIRVIDGIQFFVLKNFRIPFDFLRSFSSSNIVYIEISLAISLDISAQSNPFIF